MRKKIPEIINKIYGWVYTKEGYYFLKSGLTLDHYFKKFFNTINKEIIFFIGLIFMDAFILNKLINNFFEKFSKINDKITNLKKKNNFYSMKYTLIIFFIFIFLIFILFIFLFF